MLKLAFWNFEAIFLRMYFLFVATCFLKVWLSVWVDICILNMLHEVLPFIMYYLEIKSKSISSSHMEPVTPNSENQMVVLNV